MILHTGVVGKWTFSLSTSLSLGTRLFPGGGRVWALSYIRIVPRTECWPGQSELLIANDVMEMVFSRLSVLSTTRYGKFAVVFRVSPEYLSRAMSRLAMNVCAVSPPIANYPCIIVFCRDNLNVGTCPDPSSFLRRVWFRDYTRLLSMAESLVLRLNTGTGPGVRLRFYIIISSTHKL